jgi:hypothetical protein
VLSPGHTRQPAATELDVQETTSFGEGAAGSIYVASLNGPIYEIVEH